MLGEIPGDRLHCFYQKRNEQRNQMWSSVFGNANLSNLSGTLLEGNKDHLLNQARSDLARKELHVDSLNKSIDDLLKRTEAQNRALQDVQNEFVESRREQTRLQEELSRKEKSSSRNADPKYARFGKDAESASATNWLALDWKVKRKSRDCSTSQLKEKQ